MNLPFTSRYGSPLRWALLSSVIIFVLSILVLDGGQFAILSDLGLLLFWLFVLVVIFQRPKEPTPFDLSFISWGLWPFMLVFHLVVRIVLHLRGLE